MATSPASPTKYNLSIVLPAYNEEANIELAMKTATEVASRLCANHEILVVDDGSVDRTATLVEAASARRSADQAAEARRK